MRRAVLVIAVIALTAGRARAQSAGGPDDATDPVEQDADDRDADDRDADDADDGDADDAPAPVRDEPAPEPDSATVVPTEPVAVPVAPPRPPAPDRSYTTITFAGLLIEPTGSLSESHDSGLAATMRVGYIGNGGWGVNATVRYTPFPHDEPADTIIEAHMFYATVAPAYALRWTVLRAWGAAGIGGLYERVRTSAKLNLDDTRVDNAAAVMGHAAVGLEAHLFDNGGPMVGASYGQSIAGDDYSFYGLMAGVTFVFK